MQSHKKSNTSINITEMRTKAGSFMVDEGDDNAAKQVETDWTGAYKTKINPNTAASLPGDWHKTAIGKAIDKCGSPGTPMSPDAQEFIPAWRKDGKVDFKAQVV